jgi:hypothetical protein
MNRAIRLRGRKFDFTVPLGSGRVTPTDGGAEFEDGKRPQQTPLSVYDGEKALKLDVPVLLDGYPNRDQDPKLDQIEALCFGKDGNRPPDFTATGPFRFSGRRFVMDSLPEYGEGNGSPDGRIATVRQALTLKLREFEDADVIKPRRTRGRRGRGNGDGGTLAPATITLGHEMTLVQVAARFLEDASRAKEVGKLNGVRDVRKKLPAGRSLKLPGG